MPTADDVNLHDWEAVVGLFQAAAASLRESPLRRGSAVRIDDPSARLLATGDLHDNPDHLRKIIAEARLGESAGHHVVLQELIHGEQLINGMDFSYRVLARVARLVMQHPAQVHPLLANHELSQWTGRGVSKGAGNSVELFNDALAYVFGEQWEDVSEAIRAFIRAMPLAAIGGSGKARVLCAHSLPDERAMKHFDVDILDRKLTEDDFDAFIGSAYAMVWGRRYSQPQVEQLAECWGIKLFVLGHRHVEEGVDTFGPRVVVLNSDHQRGVVLPIDLQRIPAAEEVLRHAQPLQGIA